MINSLKPSIDQPILDHSPNHTRYFLAVTLVGAILLTVTGIAGYITKRAVDVRLSEFFNRQADQIANTYYNKIHTHVTIIEGIRGLWNASNNFTYQSFSDYLSSLDLSNIDNGGASSYFYIPAVKHEDISKFEKKIQQESSIASVYQNYVINPKSDAPVHYPATYTYPLEGRGKSIGLDFATFPERLDAITYAKDSGKLATTKAMILQTTGRPGFFFILPLYYNAKSLDLPSDRDQHFAGVVGAAFRSRSAFEQIYGGTDPYPYLDFQIYQGDASTPDRLIHDHDSNFEDLQARYTTSRVVRYQGQTWTINVQSKPSFALRDSEQKLPYIVFISGILATLILTITSLVGYFRHLRQERLAHNR